MVEQAEAGGSAKSPTDLEEASTINTTTMEENESIGNTNGEYDALEMDSCPQSGAAEESTMDNEKVNTDTAAQMLMEMSSESKKRKRSNDNEEERKSNNTSVTHGNEKEKPMEYTHIREIMEGHSDIENEHPDNNGTLPTEL